MALGPSNVRVRPAAASDVPGLRRLYDEFHSFHVRGVPDRLLLPPTDPDDGRFAKAISQVLAAADAVILVAENGGAIIGFAEMYVRDDEASRYRPGRRYGHLQSFGVTEASRLRGIGTLLLSEAERWAAERCDGR